MIEENVTDSRRLKMRCMSSSSLGYGGPYTPTWHWLRDPREPDETTRDAVALNCCLRLTLHRKVSTLLVSPVQPQPESILHSSSL